MSRMYVLWGILALFPTACYLLFEVWLFALCRFPLARSKLNMSPSILMVALLLLLQLDFNGINCFRNSYKSSCSYFSLWNFSFFYSWICEDDAKNVDRDGEVIGKLQVKFEVLFLFLFLFSSLFTKNCIFCVFLGHEERKWWWWCDVAVEWMERWVDSCRRLYMFFMKLPSPSNYFLEPFLALCNSYRSLL